MPRQVDKAILLGFIAEARSYLPSIYEGIAAYQADETQVEKIQLAYRRIHTVVGASSMVGLDDLSRQAIEIENALEEYALVQGPMSAETVADMRSGLAQIEQLLNSLAEENNAPRETPSEQEEFVAVTADMNVGPYTETRHANAIDAFETQLPSTLEVDPEMLGVFALEAEDHLRTISQGLSVLDKTPNNREALQDVRRSVHTLKGAAGVVGLKTITQLSHRMEDLLDHLYEGRVVSASETTNLLLASTDVLEALAQGVNEGRVRSTLSQLYEQYFALLKQPVSDAPSIKQLQRHPTNELVASSTTQLFGVESGLVEETDETEASEGQATTLQTTASRMVRVPLDRLDDLVKLVSEMVISRTVLEQRLTALDQQASELRRSVERLRRVSGQMETDYEATTLNGQIALRGLTSLPATTSLKPVPFSMFPADKPVEEYGFDELEFDRYTEFHRLSRELSETTSDTNSIGNELENLLGDFDGVMTRQRRLTSEIQEKLMRLRMAPLKSLAQRLERAVRVTANKQGKLANLVLEGESLELDTTVLSAIADPLLHLLRNAVAHGIETPAMRRVRGKSDRGTICLRAYHEGTQVVIEVSDDGQGIDQQALKAKAISEGIISPQQANAMSDNETLSLIFIHGLSTADEITEVSGRGVGMDVVKETVAKLKGSLSLDSALQQGAKFTIRLPMTMAVTRALIVKAHDESYAIPLNAVTQLLRLGREEIEQMTKERVLWVGGKLYPVIRLIEALNLPSSDEIISRLPVLLVKTGVDHIALVVDHIVEGREIVIKSLGTHLKNVSGLLGSTILGDGRVIPILNPADFARRGSESQLKATTYNRRPALSENRNLNVLIVDDSPSVRRVMLGLMKSVGWQSSAAKDGLDALETLHRLPSRPDAILLDVEMPRMDGYELLATLKKQDVYKEIPVIMITSRAGEKHRQKALELGAADYIAKPYQDELLLDTIRKLAQ